MKKKHNTLISDLSTDLAPVKALPGINKLGMSWFLLSAIYVVVVTRIIGPIRPGALTQLATEPRFLLETMLGVAAILWVSLLAFRSSVPAALSKPFAVTGAVLMMLWLTQYVLGFFSPALEPSTLGARHHCHFETMVYALPVILAGLYYVRRRYPLRPVLTAMSIGLAAGMLPALYMQIACMYEPSHILAFHILPGLLMVIVAAAGAAKLRPRRSDSGLS
ncbi:MAG: DUF1109 family protein [Xanthomonadales bacterium]|nr:DUF1109 family protein [Gammaproteobacteria bacterium]MBT8054543.1 DUF1109 family protein [Gammaproteobacteria bacterium]NNK51341.1 DUF1109 family protein [Xanthomonadales bacterium]